VQQPSEIFQSVTIKRYAAGAWTHGVYAPGAETTVVIMACVQPGGMKELLSLEEADRTKDQLAIWSEEPIYTLNETTGQKADRVSWDGAYWQVRRVESYGITPQLHHYHAVAVREQAS
jgi:hypothetical protein